MSKLMEYFNEVDKNAVMRAAHLREPAASMSKFGLTSDEQDALMSGEVARLAGAIGVPMIDSQLQALLVPQSIGTFSQLQALLVPQSIGALEEQ